MCLSQSKVSVDLHRRGSMMLFGGGVDRGGGGGGGAPTLWGSEAGNIWFLPKSPRNCMKN